MEKSTFFDKLRLAVEETLGRKLCTPKDFDYLVMRISNITKYHISATTLKRFWGYIDESKDTTPRIYTLNILSEFVGYKDWNSFCETSSANADIDSDFINRKSLRTQSLLTGDIVRLIWSPNRCVTVKYLGQEMFEVEESINSKLQCNDIFICSQLVENQPLVLTNLIRNGISPSCYVCGKQGGVKFEIVQTDYRGG